MNTAPSDKARFQELLRQKQAELGQILRNRDGLCIEKSADQTDEIQYASERDLAIRNVNRGSTLLGQVKAALQRIEEGDFGLCIDCDSAISPKRLAVLPWAARCVQCQEAADRGEQEGADGTELLANAA